MDSPVLRERPEIMALREMQVHPVLLDQLVALDLRFLRIYIFLQTI